MARWARHSVVLLLTLSMGCVTVPSSWKFPSPFRNHPPADSGKEQRASTHETAEETEEHPPFIASADAETPPESSTGSSATAILKHDPATRMLIEAELRDASPTERAEWIAFLGTVETAEVAGLLKERRMAEHRESEQLATGEKKRTAEQDILPAAHSLSVESTKHMDAENRTGEGSATETPVSSESPNEKSAQNSGPLSAGSAWQKKFRSLTDPNRLWLHDNKENETTPESTSDSSKLNQAGHLLSGASHQEVAAVAAANRPAQAADSATSSPVPAAQTAALETRITPGSALWEDEMAKLISLLEAEASSTPLAMDASQQADLRKQVGLRMLYLIANEPQKSLQAIPGLPPDEQEYWTSLFLGLSQYLDQTGANDPADRATQTIAQLRTAAYHLQQSANLRLRNLTFCQQINGFGNYESFPADQFRPGQTVLIYAEIRNFKSTPLEDGHFLTRIRSTVEIYSLNDGQRLVDRNSYDPTEDRSRTLRTDYYHSYRIDLPANLVPGPHLVKLILQDELTGKQATESIQFIVTE